MPQDGIDQAILLALVIPVEIAAPRAVLASITVAVVIIVQD
jgi:hypothetical protein